MRLAGEKGQTFSEFLLLSGILTAITIALLGIVRVPLREVLENAAQCIIDGAINGLTCASEGVAGPAGPPAPPPPRTFIDPTLRGVYLDWCLTYAASCGQPVADEYCRRMGYSRATAWAGPVIGSGRTEILSGQTCSGAFCGRMSSITCVIDVGS